MPLSRIKLLPVDPAGFETAEPSWDWWDVDPGIKIVIAHLQAQGPSGAPADVKRLKASATGNLQATLVDAGGFEIFKSAGGAQTSVTTWPQDNSGVNSNQAIQTMTNPALWNGATYDRLRSASAANLSSFGIPGIALTEGAGEWSVASQPAGGSQASASRAGGGVGVRHVCKGFGISAGSTVAPVLTAIAVQIRDGASGAGTILKTVLVLIAAAVGQNVPPIEVSGLNLIGSPNTAMTAEFSAGLANLLECVSLQGYDVS